ncbi:SDR family oxidoreductase [Gordonia polyisoprenivorans]|uniref:SDR family NAD(P)-dependent oxidoreductase n=1 Tax=Gordonia polyisoprenivorans TaxID=84595 RepID=UPI00036720C0|nr:SDR family NAD(P)-dependent oxidoreductase [Gordonia polyisoprenivorans]OZC30069.1 NAD(P)-dependent oxidoreductase [Gordonia polyisoprenivorans]QUD80945.1 SDR family oxidoreductase [Gordonia polyisoprenivorans]UZF58347.1 SDR family oxidoreductase [Gordonia polyisoprenivorans]
MTTTRVAIVTGAARGLGAEIALRLSADYDALVLADLSAEHPERESDPRWQEVDADVVPIACDVRDAAAVSAMFDTAAEAGALCGLVNTAGTGLFTPLVEIDQQLWDNTFAVNARGTFLTCQELVKRADGPAAIVNIASIGARLGNEMLTHYGASKAAVIELGHSVARSGALREIRCNTVLPGLILTDMWRQTIAWLRGRDSSLDGVSDNDVFAGFVQQMVPMGRPQSAGDIAEMVAFLLSDKARNVTGQSIAVDGGAVMS